MDKRKIIIFTILGIIGVTCIFFMLRPDETSEQLNDIEVKLQKNSLIASKLEAYKKNRETQNRDNSYMKSSLGDIGYESEASASKEVPEEKTTETETYIEPVVVQKRHTPRRSTASAPTDTIASPVSVKNSSSGMSDAEKARRRASLASQWGKADIPVSEKNGNQENSYPAVIHGQQEISKRGNVRIRLKKEIKTNGYTIPTNTLITGIASFSNDRMNIQINSIRVGKNVIPVVLSVFGSDGMKGLPIQYDETKKIVDGEVSSEVMGGIDQVARRIPGGIGGVVSGIAKSVKKKDDISTVLYDNTSLYLKIL